MKAVSVFILSIFISNPLFAEVGKSSTKVSSKWFAVNEASNELVNKKCKGSNVSDIQIDTKFNHTTGWVAEVSANCGGTGLTEMLIYWDYEFYSNDRGLDLRANKVIGLIEAKAPEYCSQKNKKVKTLKLLSNNNSRKAGNDEWVAVFDENLGYQWVAWLLTCK
jgi:hypothetical protein